MLNSVSLAWYKPVYLYDINTCTQLHYDIILIPWYNYDLHLWEMDCVKKFVKFKVAAMVID